MAFKFKRKTQEEKLKQLREREEKLKALSDQAKERRGLESKIKSHKASVRKSSKTHKFMSGVAKNIAEERKRASKRKPKRARQRPRRKEPEFSFIYS